MADGILSGVLSKVSRGRVRGSKPQPTDTSRSVAGMGPEHGMARTALGALHLPGFKHGGKVKKTGAYKLHKGEKVLTAKQAKSHPGLDC